MNSIVYFILSPVRYAVPQFHLVAITWK